MNTRIIRIGNSQGIRIPKPILEQSGLEGEVVLTVRKNSILITAKKTPRLGWDKAFQEMANRDDDRLIDDATPTKWDQEEWQW